ncbi:MAG: methyltransferase domain-containing protein [Halioglobus sp.]|nr:methyltransferase domain-containing protein [Halioglobus sp.]
MRAQCSDIFSELESWYATDSGRHLLAATRSAAQDMLDRAFGYHILHLGYAGEEPLCAGSPINHRIICAPRSGGGAGLLASPEELPLESDSVDAVVAHHCLEFAANPHQVIREIQRILTPQGQLLVAGFNPYSLHGIGARFRGLLRNPLWQHHQPVSERRLTDWLHLLGCEVQDVSRLYAVPPVGRGRLHRGLQNLDHWAGRHNLPLGGVYLLHATKQVAGLHRPRRLSRARGDRLIGLVPKPAPAPTPVAPAPLGLPGMEKGDVAA